MIKWFAKKRLLYLQKQFDILAYRWVCSKSNMHCAILELMKAKIKYYEVCFKSWGKYHHKFSFDENEYREYEEHLKRLNIPYDFKPYNREYYIKEKQ